MEGDGFYEFFTIATDYAGNQEIKMVADVKVGVSSRTLAWVDDDFNPSTPGWNYDHFNKIQKALRAVIEGGTVYVSDGIYYENIWIDRRVNLIGESKNYTIINGQHMDYGVYITSDRVNLSRFTVIDCYEGICVAASNCSISNCNFKNSTFGIYICWGRNNKIYNNTFLQTGVMISGD